MTNRPEAFIRGPAPKRRRTRRMITIAVPCAAISLGILAALNAPPGVVASDKQTLDEARLTLGKWIETEQIISRERKEWQQANEVLVGRLDLLRREISTLEEHMSQANAAAAESQRKRDELAADNDELKAVSAQLNEAVAAMEADVRRLYKTLPPLLQTRLEPLWLRVPEDAAASRVSTAERFQNVLGILNEVNKANNEITINYEIQPLAGGKSAEVKAMYVGLAQAYFVSGSGHAGVGRPSENGWTWQPADNIAHEISKAIEILDGKQSPAFVPLPAKLQ